MKNDRQPGAGNREPRCGDGAAMETGARLGVGFCRDHGTVTIIGHRTNGERIGFQLDAATMMRFADMVADACLEAHGIPPDDDEDDDETREPPH